ncbi:MAG: tRNA (guanosine(46)-N7)-methyltransferase TrmB [Actinomycetota bacterium]|nr:tRNA (guanosine(46)-N7)-methyltransferase TrmB [Actinomycetota bacterium]
MTTDPSRSRPARPHAKFTDDGNRVREVLSYSRRGSRLGAGAQRAWDARAGAWVIPDEAVDDPDFSWAHWFGRFAPLVVEIGSGAGESLAALAASRPSYDVVAFEVWRPGVASSLTRLEAAGACNVRLVQVDAVWSMKYLFARGSIAELWTFFPDPWPKQRHHRRRLVQPDLVHDAASALVEGGLWRLATDWSAYAEQMAEVLEGEPLLTGSVTPRWEERPLTRFERRGLAAGRPVTDLTYRRITSGP